MLRLLRRAGLATHEQARHLPLVPRSLGIGDVQAHELQHGGGGLLRDDTAALRLGSGLQLLDGERAIDTAVEEGAIARRQGERADGDTLAEGHLGDGLIAELTRQNRASALGQLARGGGEQTEAAEVVLHALRPGLKRHLGRADVGGVGEHLPEPQGRVPLVEVVHQSAAELDRMSDVEAGVEGDHPRVEARRQCESLEHGAQLKDRAGAAVEHLVRRRLARGVDVEVGLAGEAEDLTGLHIDHDADAAEGPVLGDGLAQLVVQSGLHPQVQGQGNRPGAGLALDGIVQGPLSAGQARSTLVGEADQVRRGGSEGIDPSFLFLEADPWKAQILQARLVVRRQASQQIFAAARDQGVLNTGWIEARRGGGQHASCFAGVPYLARVEIKTIVRQVDRQEGAMPVHQIRPRSRGGRGGDGAAVGV